MSPAACRAVADAMIAFAGDLNAVAVLLNNVVSEYIAQYRRQSADEVRTWGQGEVKGVFEAEGMVRSQNAP